MKEEIEQVKILIVDSEGERYATPLEEMLSHQFPDKRIQFTICSNYRDSLDKLEEHDLAVIGLDLTMEYNAQLLSDFLANINEIHPGFRLISFIQQKYPKIKILALATTSQCQESSTPDMVTKDSKRGCLILNKPISASMIIQAIKDTLGS